jgi:hypothetical protein
VILSLPERAIPPVAPADEIGEGIVIALVPDARHADESRRRLWGIPERQEQQEKAIHPRIVDHEPSVCGCKLREAQR